MKAAIVWILAPALVCGALVTSSLAQRGMGERSGVARQADEPEIVTLSGKLMEIKTGPCEKTTGRSPIGTHILLQNDKGEPLNVHLGPEAAVAGAVAKLKVGKKVTVKAFRTDKMPENHYTAQSLSSGKTTVELRDAGLRPVWAGPRGRQARPADTSAKRADSTTDRSDDEEPALGPGPGRGRQGGGPPWARGRGWGGGGGGWGGGPPWAGGADARGGGGPDAAFQADRTLFHYLLENRDQIRRKVTKRPDGVDTLTESDNPTVALAIQGHVEAMHQRVEKLQPIHLRDPLFVAIFGQAKKIDMKVTKTKKGVRVVETSEAPYVVKLIQAHAAVVDGFVANGFAEARQNHVVPKSGK